MQKYQFTALKAIIKKIYVLAVFGFAIVACNPVKHIPKGKVFLKNNWIAISSKVIDQDALYPYLRQKSNKRALWVVKIKMQQYLLYNDSALAVRNEKKHHKTDAKNQKRLAAGKDTIAFKPVLGFRLKKAGEAPVIFDTRATTETAEQLNKALFNKGYFKNEIFVDLEYNSDSTKVNVIYSAAPGEQYNLNRIALVIADSSLTSAIKIANTFSLLHTGDFYNTEVIDAERLRFTTEMRNQGFFYFAKEYIDFEIDSALSGNEVNIKIIIKNPTIDDPNSDQKIVTQHKKYTIGHITLNTSFNPNFTDQLDDSIHFENLIYVNLSRLRYNPHSFINKLFFKKGDLYNQNKEQRSYARISGLNNFSYINIGFLPDANNPDILNCNILMTPLPSQSIGIETEGTTSSGNLGVSGYLNYTHRNLFGNAEEFKIRLKGGVEAQQTNSNTDDENKAFNTIEWGAETSIIFQELILPYGIKSTILKKFNRPKTSVNFIINYQQRPDFTRRLIHISTGYFFTRKDVNTNEVFLYPIDISYINIDKEDAFQARLDELNNPLLNSTYDNQFILGSRVIETWSNRISIQQKSFILNRIQAEVAGNALSLIDQSIPNAENNGDFTTLGGVRYAQFFKFQNDWHLTNRVSRNSSLAYKFLAGIGVPYGNSEALPYDRSFYGGGANDNRGWRARTLGPGSLLDSDSVKSGVDQVADIKIQISAEYRFNIVKSIEGAAFIDAGNIWLLKNDPERANAHFDISRFYKELAIAVGPGIRLNFGFLLVRFDWGFKIYNPGLPVTQRWLGQDNNNFTENIKNSTFNLGIGYPF
ncbi:MAG: outer membrane protein assembly factor BamA [Salibacteraceae bacterium]